MINSNKKLIFDTINYIQIYNKDIGLLLLQNSNINLNNKENIIIMI